MCCALRGERRDARGQAWRGNEVHDLLIQRHRVQRSPTFEFGFIASALHRRARSPAGVPDTEHLQLITPNAVIDPVLDSIETETPDAG